VISKPAEEIISEIKNLLDSGYSEFTLTGINIALYGRDIGMDPASSAGTNSAITPASSATTPALPTTAPALDAGPTMNANFDLPTLLGLISQIPGDFRIVLGSLEPTVVDEEFVRRLMEIPKLLPEFHISLQSGSDNILKSMKRPYTMEGFEEIVKIIREKYPEAKISTDIIVGYPGETEADFEASVDAVRHIGFDHVHVFKYSRRKGTAATEMPNQVPEEKKSKRSKRLIELSGSTK
jgi:threonylcarbamoyladenosine tRNA methylthiotransferase MtaB